MLSLDFPMPALYTKRSKWGFFLKNKTNNFLRTCYFSLRCSRRCENMKFRRYLEYGYLVSLILAIVSYMYLVYSRVGFFYKLHLAKVYKEVVFTPAFLIPLSFLLLSFLCIVLDKGLSRKKNN